MNIVEQLFRRYCPKMLLVATMIWGSEEEAKDLVSDVFSDMLKGKLKASLECTEGFFVVMVRNRCMNLLRRKSTLERVKGCLTLDTSIQIAKEENLVASKIDEEVDKLDAMLEFMDRELTPQTRKIVNMH